MSSGGQLRSHLAGQSTEARTLRPLNRPSAVLKNTPAARLLHLGMAARREECRARLWHSATRGRLCLFSSRPALRRGRHELDRLTKYPSDL